MKHVSCWFKFWETFFYLRTLPMVGTQQLRQCLGNLINVHFENIVVYLVVKVKNIKNFRKKKGKDLLVIGNHIKLVRFQTFSKFHTHAILKNLHNNTQSLRALIHYSSSPQIVCNPIYGCGTQHSWSNGWD